VSKIIIGTSGYSYKDWVGIIYPEGTKEKDFLQLYSQEFKMVELNFSYYKQPEAKMLQTMVNQTSSDFLFCIKAHKSLTHEIDAQLSENIAIFKRGISPLIDASKLGVVLFQFPYSFHYTDVNRKYLDELLRAFAGIPLVVEFRNDEWQKDSVYMGLKDRGIGLVNVDEPALKRLPKPTNLVTSDYAYIRLHGRNKANWWSGNNTTRYDYLYSEGELAEWLPRIMEIIKTAKLLLVAFNNHYKGQAVQNARQLQALLANKV